MGHTRPKFDDHDDWTLHKAVELGSIGRTFLKFSRLINTCDEEDYPIGVCLFLIIMKFVIALHDVS